MSQVLVPKVVVLVVEQQESIKEVLADEEELQEEGEPEVQLYLRVLPKAGQIHLPVQTFHPIPIHQDQNAICHTMPLK